MYLERSGSTSGRSPYELHRFHVNACGGNIPGDHVSIDVSKDAYFNEMSLNKLYWTEKRN